ncbi:MAG: hypothetical protein VX951_08855 [Planctomycetota bacterium]|nr:hypothetical protein [Planctomycetota bacterium]
MLNGSLDSRNEGYPLVFVHWVDSCEPADNSDIGAYDMPEPQAIMQCGFLVHDEEDHIVIAGGLKPALETYDYVIAIPRVAVAAIRYLEPVDGPPDETS